MQKLTTLILAGVSAYLLAGCSASGVNPVSPSRVCSLSSNVLQLNVGTANLFGTATGTNVAVTFRQSAAANCYAGDSGALVSTPTLTLPTALAGPAGTADLFGATILTGPAAGEIGTTSMTGIGQTPADTSNTSATATFGDDGGAFGLGIEPFNEAAHLGLSGDTGVPASEFPYPVPVYDPIVAGGGTDDNQFIPGGGPPAFCPTGVANCNAAGTNAGFGGVSEGLDVFEIAPVAGTYSLSVSVPANTGAVTKSASAVMSSTVLLPTIIAAVPATYTASTGTLTFNNYVLPAGVTQAYVQVTDIGPTLGGQSCVGNEEYLGYGQYAFVPASPAFPMYYTAVLTASGVPAAISGLCSAAANTTASGGTATDGDEFGVQVIGFDYNAYGASYPSSLGNPAPSLVGTGSSHQADLTISPLTEYTLPGGNVFAPAGAITPLVIHRRSAQSIGRR